MPKTYNLVGNRYGKLLVLSEAERDKRGARQWLCQCDCGATALRITNELLSGHVTSCSRQCGTSVANKARAVHEAAGEETTPAMTKLYDLWRNIKARCGAHPNYKSVRMCDEWSDSFERFASDIGEPPGLGREWSLDRYPDNAGDYKPGNVRWATSSQQNRNKRANIYIEWGGKNMILADWATELGIPYGRLKTRWRRGKRPPELFS